MEPYVWLLIMLPLSAVIGGIITAVYAIRSDDGLVVDDYYKRGLEINRTLDRDHAAVHYGLRSTIQMNPDTGQIRIILEGNDTFLPPDSITVSFLYSTRGGHDRKETFIKTAADTYDGQLPELIRGRWYILIEAEDWRLLEVRIIN